MEKEHYFASLAMINKDIKANDYCGAQMNLEYLLKDFLIDGKLLAIKNPIPSDYEGAKQSFSEILQILENFQNQYPKLFPQFNIKTDLSELIDKVSEDGHVEFEFNYDHIYEDTLYENVEFENEDNDLEYNEKDVLDMMFPNKEDDDSWDE